ncbi:MAG TPA: nuclear transport factor 2 family protein [Chitinophagaceae bacterium]|nr:nuclear transport factor 2 family protein [Chitinophagaceae bacterium]
MRLTKKLEAEILEVYNTYWDAFFKGDLKSVASLLDDNCHVIGSSVGEVFNDKRSLLKYLKATIGQIKGKAELRNRKISVTTVGKDIMIHDQSDLYLLIDDTWTFYGHGRASTLFSKKNNKWKITHLHRSLPDYKAGEGEQVNTAKIKAENLQLRDAVKRRTVELENKNRELEIESAVERVRAKALAMHRSEEIHEVVRTLRNELFGLKLTGVTAVSICLRQDDGRVRLWDITDLEDTGRYTWDVTFTMNEIDPRLWIRQIWSSKKKIIAFEQDSNDLKRTLKWLSQYDKKTADEITELIRVNKIKRGWHRAVKLANGRLITDFINEPPAEIESILLKMGAAFDLAYKRFLDLKNAETQAKEARIELALERVRARAMAMHNSDELAELVSTVFNELTHLDFKLTSCIIWIHDSEKAIDTLWIASAEMNKPAEPYQVTPFHKDFFRSVIHAWKSKDPKWVYTFAGPEKRNFEKAFFKELPNLTDSLRKALKVPQQVVFSASFNNFGGLEIVETEALTDEKFEILHRFGRVFDLSYTRFNDLKKAEAQTKEAHTEAALER